MGHLLTCNCTSYTEPCENPPYCGGDIDIECEYITYDPEFPPEPELYCEETRIPHCIICIPEFSMKGVIIISLALIGVSLLFYMKKANF